MKTREKEKERVCVHDHKERERERERSRREEMIIHVGHIHAPQRNQYSEFGSFDGYIETICFFFFQNCR